MPDQKPLTAESVHLTDAERAALDRTASAWNHLLQRDLALPEIERIIAARLAPVQALADQWAKRWDVPEAGVLDMSAKHYREAAQRLHAVLAGVTTPPEVRTP